MAISTKSMLRPAVSSTSTNPPIQPPSTQFTSGQTTDIPLFSVVTKTAEFASGTSAVATKSQFTTSTNITITSAPF